MTPVLARIKRAVRGAVALCGGIDGSAATADRSRSVVGDWNNRERAIFPSLDCALALDEIAVSRGELPPIVAALARELGGVFVPHIDGGADQDSALGLVMQLAARLGEVASETAADIANDGVIDAVEAEAILGKLHAMDRVSAQLRHVVIGIRESGVKGAGK
jgi:hypothetical protein